MKKKTKKTSAKKTQRARKPKFTPQQELAISSWVNDQFETSSPHPIKNPPRGIAKYPHWKSDPQSGVTGTVYFVKGIIFYSAPGAQGKIAWWNLGPLPPGVI